MNLASVPDAACAAAVCLSHNQSERPAPWAPDGDGYDNKLYIALPVPMAMYVQLGFGLVVGVGGRPGMAPGLIHAFQSITGNDNKSRGRS